MIKKSTYSEASESLEELAAYIHFNNEFERELQRPLTDQEKAFLKWLSEKHINGS